MKKQTREQLLAKKKLIERELEKFDNIDAEAMRKEVAKHFKSDLAQLLKLSYFEFKKQVPVQVLFQTDFWVDPFDTDQLGSGDVYVDMKLPAGHNLQPFFGGESSLCNTSMDESIETICPEIKKQFTELKKFIKSFNKKMVSFAKQHNTDYGQVIEWVSTEFQYSSQR